MKTQSKRGKKVLGKNTTIKRVSTKKNSKSSSLLNRFQNLTRRGQLVVYGLVFAAIGGGYYLYQSLASDGLPTGEHELVISYEIGMAHQIKEDDFNNTPGGPSLLLYGNGLMLCNNDMAMGHHSEVMEGMPAWNSRQLSRDEMHALVDKLRSGGFDKAMVMQRPNHDRIDPVSVGRFIRINTSLGADEAVLLPGDPTKDFNAAESILNAECAKTTTPYEPEDVYAETITLPDDNPDAKKADKALPGNVDVDGTPKGKGSKELKGKVAKDVKNQLSRKSKIYKKGNQAVRARYVDKIPDWDALQPRKKSDKGKVLAATDNTARWVVFVPSDQSVPSWGTDSFMKSTATSIQSWYKSQTGKTFTISSYSVVRGSKPASAYKTCPSDPIWNTVCRSGAVSDQLNAAYYNIQSELESKMNMTGFSTNVLTNINFPSNCMGVGGPASNVINDNEVGEHNAGFSLAPYGTGGCTDSSQRGFVSAHELGHTFGLSHTCDKTLMGQNSGSCPISIAWPKTALNSSQGSLLSTKSPYFISTTASATTSTASASTYPSIDSASNVNADFNGDGKTDLAGIYDYGNNTSKIWIWSSTGSGFNATAAWTSSSGGWNANATRLFAGDFNGDGKSDLAAVYDYGGTTTGIWIWPGAGNGTLGAPIRAWYGTTWAALNAKYTSGDFNGDGKTDLAAFFDYGNSTTKLWVYTSTGTGFNTSSVWSSSGYNGAKSRPFAGDFNGDGKADVAAVYDYGNNTTGIWVWAGNGGGAFNSPVKQWSGTSWSAPLSRYAVGDFNGDNKTDFAAFYDYGKSTTKLWVFKSTGSGFGPTSVWSSTGWTASKSRLLSGDFNGDGKTDVDAIYDYGSNTTGIWAWNGTGSGAFNAPVRTWYSTSWASSKAKYLSFE